MLMKMISTQHNLANEKENSLKSREGFLNKKKKKKR